MYARHFRSVEGKHLVYNSKCEATAAAYFGYVRLLKLRHRRHAAGPFSVARHLPVTLNAAMSSRFSVGQRCRVRSDGRLVPGVRQRSHRRRAGVACVGQHWCSCGCVDTHFALRTSPQEQRPLLHCTVLSRVCCARPCVLRTRARYYVARGEARRTQLPRPRVHGASPLTATPTRVHSPAPPPPLTAQVVRYTGVTSSGRAAVGVETDVPVPVPPRQTGDGGQIHRDGRVTRVFGPTAPGHVRVLCLWW